MKWLHNKSASNNAYLPGIDGLRALAVLAVIAYHMNLDWANGGFLGVGIFFTLSGYLITDLLLEEKRRNDDINLKTFYIRRSRRLLPALLSVLLVTVAWLTVMDPSRLPSLHKEIWSTFLYANNWVLILSEVSYFDSFGPPSPFTHLWSLAVEGQFYLIWPLLLIIALRYDMRRGWLFAWTLVAAAVSAIAMAVMYEPGTDPSRIYYGTDTRVFALLIGAALAIICPRQRLSGQAGPKTRQIIDMIGSIGFIIIIYMLFHISEYDSVVYRGGLVLLAAATAMLMAALAHPASRLNKLFGWKPLQWIGVRSYSLYLWHYPVIMLSSPVVDTNGFNAVRAIAQLVVSLALAALSWRYIEEPIRRGAVGTRWTRLKSKEWTWHTWHTITWRQWAASACMVVLLVLFGLGMGYEGKASSIQSASSSLDSSSVETGNTSSSHKQGVEGLQPKPILPKKPKPTSKPDDKSREKESKAHGSIEADNDWSVTVIGDSVMVDVAPYLQKLLPGAFVDAQIGRQMWTLPDTLTKLQKNGELGEYIIIALGTNGVFNQKQLEAQMNSLQDVKHIILVNTRMPERWESEVNDKLVEVAQAYPNVTLFDWYAASQNQDAYFEPDGTHLRPQGARAYASKLAAMVRSLAKAS
ncbi:acyltransferase family protein [Paenibacillus sp. 481]|uniref:acyltransferase family protein n=1 Tax=Paenibacillus sp. 481 TaxID=2835869 RepID=UPI001E382F49|nr:acyltransferase family protein [Paenibacillus sp. 481]UHA74689.1 acetyltransferase [Paenibacillus sp. 481]